MDPPRTSLCPGYTQVSTFSAALLSPRSKASSLERDPNIYSPDDDGEGAGDGEEEYEEEVEYVVLDLGNIEPTLVPSSSTYRLIGLDTPTPFLQLSGTIFQGRQESLLGSELIFTDDKESTTSGQKKRGVTHVSTTSKRIAFKEVQLRPKDKDTSQPQRSQATEHVESGGGGSILLEEEGLEDDNQDENLEYTDDGDMDVDDALEYVDLSQAGPSISLATPASVPGLSSASPSPEMPSTSAPISSFISSVASPTITGKGKGKDTTPGLRSLHGQREASVVEDVPIDPALRIDRLTGISPPLTRAPRGSKKAMSGGREGAANGSTAVAGKGKGKAKEDVADIDTAGG
ncbi:hypothetical protein AN958_05981 [Leucoagaricus sp. SymC.cos]|nr:hypothetical protein AN958_05981 [Leucoagaricus sp. SymC.cos]